MSAFVDVTISWDGTNVVVSSEHDRESEGRPSDSVTNVHDVIGMLRDCATRAEAAVAAYLISQEQKLPEER